MKKRSTVKIILYTLGSIIVFLSLAIWVFLSFFFQDTLNQVVIPKIEQAAFNATEGRYELTLKDISYDDGDLLCKTFVLFRVASDSSERGTILERLTIDSVRFKGLSWWDVVWGNDLRLTSLQMNAPKLYLISIDSLKNLKRIQFDTSHKPKFDSSDVPVISFDSIVLDNVSVFLPKPSEKSIKPTYENIRITLKEFLLDTKSTAPKLPLYSKHIDFYIPEGSYSLSDSLYNVSLKGIHGRVSDSVVHIDSISYSPNYGRQAFADMHKYVQSSLGIKFLGMNIRGINFTGLLNGDGLHVRACEVSRWYVDYYGDKRKPRDPRPPDAVLPHTILSSIKARVIVDSIILNNGLIEHRERTPGSVRPSLITFTNARVVAYPFCTDTASPLYSEPMRFSVNAMFMGKAKLVGKVSYPIHHKSFDLQMDATVGGFDLPVLNSYLVSNERKEVTEGRLLGGELSMNVRSGIGRTTVSPRYKDLSLKILADGAKESRGILEGLKTFIANTFVLKTENIDTEDKKAISATTTLVWSRKQEFFEFIWLALLKSIQQVLSS